MESQLLLLVSLLILSGIFSSAEIALTSLSLAKVQTLEGDKRLGSKAVFRLKKNPQATLITILVGNNLVNILIPVMATLWGTKLFGDNAAGILTGILMVMILVFGEIIPKTLGQKYAEGVSRLFAPLLLALTYFLSPIVWILDKFIHLLMRLLKAKNPISSVSEEELLAMVDIGTQEGVIEEDEQELIENVLEFSDTVAEEVMTIRDDIECMEAHTTIAQAAQFFIDHSHSRIPVYEGDLDNVIGILTVHDILNLTHNGQENLQKKLKELHFNPPIIVPKTKPINKLFEALKHARKHIAIVVDERGKTLGLVTMEDIIEEIVGDIVDEQDRERSDIHRIEKNKWEANSEATIEELNEALDVELDYPEHQTISLLLLEKLQGFPKEGEFLEYDNVRFEVKKMGRRKIDLMTLSKLNKSEDKEG